MKILFEHQHLYYLPQFEPVIIELKDRGVRNIFFSLSLSVPTIEKEIFKKEAARLEIEIIQATTPKYFTDHFNHDISVIVCSS